MPAPVCGAGALRGTFCSPRAIAGAVAVVAYVVARLLMLAHVQPLTAPDSDGYLAQYREGVGALWGLERPCGYPLFLWLCGFDLAWAVCWQRLIGAGAWVCLAVAMARSWTAASAQCVALCGVLAVSLTLNMLCWDALILTESLTLSLLALFYAAWLWAPRPRAAVWLLGALLALAGVLPLALRDAHAALAPVFALLLLGEGARAWRGGDRQRGGALAGAALVILALTAAHLADAARAGRGWSNAAQLLLRHVLTDRAHADWLAARHGLPRQAVIYADVDGRPSVRYDETLMPWLRSHAPQAWRDFLLHHPAWAWQRFAAPPSFYGTAIVEYLGDDPTPWRAARLRPTMALHALTYRGLGWLLGARWLHEVMLLATLVLGGVWLAGIVAPARVAAPRWLPTALLLIAAALAATVLALFGDAIEVWRHGLPGLQALYLFGVWCAAAGVQAVARRRERRCAC